jgi:hypothetical protein
MSAPVLRVGRGSFPRANTLSRIASQNDCKCLAAHPRNRASRVTIVKIEWNITAALELYLLSNSINLN